MKKITIGLLVVGLLVTSYWFLVREKNMEVISPEVISTSTPTPTLTPPPISINSSTDLNKLLDESTPRSYDSDFKNLTETAK